MKLSSTSAAFVLAVSHAFASPVGLVPINGVLSGEPPHVRRDPEIRAGRQPGRMLPAHRANVWNQFATQTMSSAVSETRKMLKLPDRLHGFVLNIFFLPRVRSVSASSFCSAFLQPTNTITATATVTNVAVLTAIDTITASTTTTS
jgi:hypothetical protein